MMQMKLLRTDPEIRPTWVAGKLEFESEPEQD
jgi:hypothetical protein